MRLYITLALILVISACARPYQQRSGQDASSLYPQLRIYPAGKTAEQYALERNPKLNQAGYPQIVGAYTSGAIAYAIQMKCKVVSESEYKLLEANIAPMTVFLKRTIAQQDGISEAVAEQRVAEMFTAGGQEFADRGYKSCPANARQDYDIWKQRVHVGRDLVRGLSGL